MATKAYRARVLEPEGDLQDALARTHQVYNLALAQMIERYVGMRKGKHGPECRELVQLILTRANTFAHGVMDKLSRPEITSTLSEDWIETAQRRMNDSGPLFLQHDCFAVVEGRRVRTVGPSGSGVKKSDDAGALNVPAKFWHAVCDDASAFLKGYSELLAQWKAERRQWLAEKGEWEQTNPEFICFWRESYEPFEAECERLREAGQAGAGQTVTRRKRNSRVRGRRIDRWHLWYEWLNRHPEVVAWRGKAEPTDFHRVPADVAEKIKARCKRQDRQVAKLLDELRKLNPELAELEAKRRTYVRNYLRFRRPPTFTLPSPDRHPRWFSMEKEQFYKGFDPETGDIKLHLIDQDEAGIWHFRWFHARLQLDPRLRPSIRAMTFASEGRLPPYISDKKVGRKLDNPPERPQDRRAGIRGAKLVVKGHAFAVIFTVTEQNEPSRAQWRKVAKRLCPADNLVGPADERIPLRILALDLGIRHAAAFQVAEGSKNEEGWTLHTVKKGFLPVENSPALGALRMHQRMLRFSRRQRGRPVGDERSFVELQDHATHMADDRFKKVARAIVELARAHRVHLVLFEKLDTLKPMAEAERWMNRQLRDMNRRKVVEAVQHAAEDFGILVDDGINPFLTSHVCSKCARPGYRFSIKAKNAWKEGLPRGLCDDYGYPVWEQGGHLFRCPWCGYRANADINAAGNLLARFFGLWAANLKRKDWIYTWELGGEQFSFNAKEEFALWGEQVRARKSTGDDPF